MVACKAKLVHCLTHAVLSQLCMAGLENVSGRLVMNVNCVRNSGFNSVVEKIHGKLHSLSCQTASLRPFFLCRRTTQRANPYADHVKCLTSFSGDPEGGYPGLDPVREAAQGPGEGNKTLPGENGSADLRAFCLLSAEMGKANDLRCETFSVAQGTPVESQGRAEGTGEGSQERAEEEEEESTNQDERQKRLRCHEFLHAGRDPGQRRQTGGARPSLGVAGTSRPSGAPAAVLPSDDDVTTQHGDVIAQLVTELGVVFGFAVVAAGVV